MAVGVDVWRIAKQTPHFAADDLSGEGAKSVGGRWNSKACPVVYCAATIALATLETLAHLGDNITARNRFLVKISIPAPVWAQRETIEVSQLHPTWLAEPPGSTTIVLGDTWLTANSAPLLLVPSIIVPEECNVLINPRHPLAAKITAQVTRQFIYDPRL